MKPKSISSLGLGTETRAHLHVGFDLEIPLQESILTAVNSVDCLASIPVGTAPLPFAGFSP